MEGKEKELVEIEDENVKEREGRDFEGKRQFTEKMERKKEKTKKARDKYFQLEVTPEMREERGMRGKQENEGENNVERKWKRRGGGIRENEEGERGGKEGK